MFLSVFVILFCYNGLCQRIMGVTLSQKVGVTVALSPCPLLLPCLWCRKSKGLEKHCRLPKLPEFQFWLSYFASSGEDICDICKWRNLSK